MFSSLSAFVSPALDRMVSALHTVPPVAVLGAVSAWTSVVCLGVSRRAARSRAAIILPTMRAMVVAVVGAPLWCAAAWLQPVAALQVCGAAVALVFSWEVGGVLERLVTQRR